MTRCSVREDGDDHGRSGAARLSQRRRGSVRDAGGPAVDFSTSLFVGRSAGDPKKYGVFHEDSPRWMVDFHGKIPSFEMDDDWGYPYDLGNYHMRWTKWTKVLFQEHFFGVDFDLFRIS